MKKEEEKEKEDKMSEIAAKGREASEGERGEQGEEEEEEGDEDVFETKMETGGGPKEKGGGCYSKRGRRKWTGAEGWDPCTLY